MVKDIQKAIGVTADGIWGPKTFKALFAALNIKDTVSSDTKTNLKAVQKAVGVTVDGIYGPKTEAAIKLRLTPFLGSETPVKTTSSRTKTVFIDPGHTADQAREWPSTFSEVNWDAVKFAKVADILKFDKGTHDSIEHMLNVYIATFVKEILEAKNCKVVLYDNPALSNNAEITQVYTRSNALKPDAFVSIHNNAVGSSGWKKMGCTASGSVALYYSKCTEGKKLASIIAKKLEAYRKAAGGPDNRRGNILNTSSVAVLSKALPSIPATLLEVCFYDNIDDLLFTVTHAKEIAEQISDGIIEYLA